MAAQLRPGFAQRMRNLLAPRVDARRDLDVVLGNAFTMLSVDASVALCRAGEISELAAGELVCDPGDETPRIGLLVEGLLTATCPDGRSVSLRPGIVWNEITFAAGSRSALAGARITAAHTGATVVQWAGRDLLRLIERDSARYTTLVHAVLRGAGTLHTRVVERATFIPPATLHRGATLSQLISKPVVIVAGSAGRAVVGYAMDVAGAQRELRLAMPKQSFEVRLQAGEFVATQLGQASLTARPSRQPGDLQ